MANRVAWLTKRVKIGGQWFVRKPIIKTSGFVTEKVEHNGQSVHAAGTFVLEWYENGKRQRKPLTASTLEAQDALRKKTQTLEARSNGAGSGREVHCTPSKVARNPFGINES